MDPANKKVVCRNRLSLLAPISVISISVLLVILYSARFWYYVKSPNVELGVKNYTYLYIPTGSDFRDLLLLMKQKSILKDEKSFIFTAAKKHFGKTIKPGKYRIRNRMSNNELVNLLRSGIQEPIRLSFQNARTLPELAGKLGRQIEADSASFMRLFSDTLYLSKFGIDPDNVFVLFIPDTYELFWNTSAKQLMSKMSQEQKAFWNEKRRHLLDSSGLTVKEAVTLASIVEKETNKDSEKPDIAGVYINRLRKGWPLQADPTVIFALQDYTIRRITMQHLKADSRYNTYIHTGLPPGPICIPSISSIDAVLKFRRHRYMYFCAKDDFSGYHNFAETMAEHAKNAVKYQKALDNMNIK